MYQKLKKLMAVLCMIAVMVTALPPVSAEAATVPKYKKTYANLYENGADKGKYKFTLTNLKKGQVVKWSVSGAGKSYVTLKRSKKTAAGKTMDNILYVDTKGKTAAKNKKVTLVAKVYSSAGKLQATVKTSGKIKVKPTAVTMAVPTEAADVLQVGSSYKFSYSLKPANATSTNVWTVTGEDGMDYSFYMSSSGVFKPMKAGNYTIKIAAKIGSKEIKSDTALVEVADFMQSVEQTAANKVKVKYSGDMRNTVEAETFTIKNTAGASIVAKNLAFSDDGTEVTITTYSTFKDGVTYSVSDGVKAMNFEASVGVPVKLEILTERVTVGKETEIEYVLMDQKGIDVSSIYSGNIEYTVEAINGYMTDNKKLYMTTVGKTATVTLKYTSKTDPNLKLEGTAVIMCVAAETSGNTNFTLTNMTTTPDYTLESYKDNRKVSIGKTYYAYFRALDTDNAEIKYDSIKYESSNPDMLIITSAGKVTPIQSGTVQIIVTASYAGEEYTYSYDVTVAEAPYLSTIKLSTNSLKMSNVYNTEYHKYIGVTAYDQYGESYPLTTESANISDSNVLKANIASYDAVDNRLLIKTSSAVPGTYNYTLTLTADGKKASATFSIVVVSIPATGTETYEIEIDKPVADLSLNSAVTGTQYVNIRLAKYRDGVFMNYMSYTSATVTKDGYYYTTDLINGKSANTQTLGASSRLSLKLLEITSDTCKKAETGVYTISLQYYSSADHGYKTLTTTLQVTDTQDTPTIQIERITANKNCATALELAQNCVIPSEGTIIECEVTGETSPGSKVAVKSGDQVNIKTITVQTVYTIANGQKVTVTYTIRVGKTLTNA
ncbi:MAG: hypothetical protein J6B28_08280 [Eubacterium sp.]|nr:hypothetical protein [Eubacterium sp.]